jgi:hypothetical protein
MTSLLMLQVLILMVTEVLGGVQLGAPKTQFGVHMCSVSSLVSGAFHATFSRKRIVWSTTDLKLLRNLAGREGAESPGSPCACACASPKRRRIGVPSVASNPPTVGCHR